MVLMDLLEQPEQWSLAVVLVAQPWPFPLFLFV